MSEATYRVLDVYEHLRSMMGETTYLVLRPGMRGDVDVYEVSDPLRKQLIDTALTAARKEQG